MAILLFAVVLLGLAGVAALSCGSSARWSTRVGAGGAVIGSVVGMISVAPVLLGAPGDSLRLPWEAPYGSFFVALDALSAFFLLLIFVLSAVTAIYGSGYLQAYSTKNRLGPSWFFFNLLIASMAMVVIARNGVLFLMAWEVMALASFFLVTFEDDHEQVREAGWVYLVATHLGTAFLLVLFILLGQEQGSLDFDQFSASAGADMLFLLAVIGFGAKAGFMPLHVWLPEAHPAAPTHVSALMSGVMIKTGIYGLVRILTFLGPPPLWWGWLLCGIGLSSGILGLLFALAQRDLKRVLAYSSVENIGVITLGLGLWLIGISTGALTLALCGLAGGLFHVANHALFKGLLFLSAGAVMHGAGTRDIERLGGLLKRMPWAGHSFLLGAVAIAGLPPLNGFLGEFLIYFGAFHGVMGLGISSVAPMLGSIVGLALIGGLSAVCFTGAFGVVFLGAPRSPQAVQAHDASLAMRLALGCLASGCVLIVVFSPWAARAFVPLLADLTRLSKDVVSVHLEPVMHALSAVVMGSCGLLAVLVGLAGIRRRLLMHRQVETHVTWDCGYARPTPRMQYTASSFSQPLTNLFHGLLRTHFRYAMTPGVFPRAAFLATETEDLAHARLYHPLFVNIGRGLASWRWVQHGQVHLYVLYIALTLLALLAWKLG